MSQVNSKRDGNFDDRAENYDAQAATIWKFHTDVVQHIIAQGEASLTDAVLLEFGCGTGNILLPLCQHVKHGYGVDISTNMCQKAREKIQTQAIANATVLELDLQEPSQLRDVNFPPLYDWIVCCMTLHHVPDPMSKLELFTKLLKDGGTLVLVEFVGAGTGHHSHEHHHKDEAHEKRHTPRHHLESQKVESAAPPHANDPNHAHSHHHHHQEHSNEPPPSKNAHDDDDDKKQAMRDIHGIFSDGFSPQAIQKALESLGRSKMETIELPALEGMDEDHPFFGLPVAIMFVS
jgi:ubiquinone/menaquinone biosynthesis C-methylase UbiE